jgi:predicted amidophosphoribosyltransferase
MIIHADDGRYAHMPNCNEQCNESGHWLRQAMLNCPGCGSPLPHHEAKCQYRGLDEAGIREAMKP